MEKQTELATLTVPAVDIPLWLLDRRRLCKDWGKRIKAVHTKRDSIIEAIRAKSTLSNIHSFLDDHENSKKPLHSIQECS